MKKLVGVENRRIEREQKKKHIKNVAMGKNMMTGHPAVKITLLLVKFLFGFV